VVVAERATVDDSQSKYFISPVTAAPLERAVELYPLRLRLV